MQAFLLTLLRNVLISAALAWLSAVIYRPKAEDAPKPSKDDYTPTADEGTEIKALFGTGPVPLLVVAVMAKSISPIRRG